MEIKKAIEILKELKDETFKSIINQDSEKIYKLDDKKREAIETVLKELE